MTCSILLDDKVWHLLWDVTCKESNSWWFCVPIVCASCWCRTCTRQQSQVTWVHENLHMHYSKGLGGLNCANGQHALFRGVQYGIELRILQESHLVCCNPCQSHKDISRVMALTSWQTCLKLRKVMTPSWLQLNVLSNTCSLFLATWETMNFLQYKLKSCSSST